MKEIDQMNAGELAEEVLSLRVIDEQLATIDEIASTLRAIHNLTRWIPVSEQMPSEEDGDRHGQILIFEVENESPNRGYQQLVKWDAIGKPDYFYAVTHWQRITPPETP